MKGAVCQRCARARHYIFLTGYDKLSAEQVEKHREGNKKARRGAAVWTGQFFTVIATVFTLQSNVCSIRR